MDGLDVNHWYWYQDLIWSKKTREAGGVMGVDHTTSVHHVYRRNSIQYPITRKRYATRRKRDVIERKLLRERYGKNWRDILWARA